MDDFFLMAEIRRDKAWAFKELFMRYYDQLCHFLLIFNSKEDLAEEVVQDFFAYFWEKRRSIEINSSVKYYIFSSCKNRLFNLLKKHSKIDDKEDVFFNNQPKLHETVQNPEHILAFKDLHSDFSDAVESLPEKAKKVFKQKYYDKASHNEIAASLGISVSMVEKHLTNAYQQLKKKLAIYNQ